MGGGEVSKVKFVILKILYCVEWKKDSILALLKMLIYASCLIIQSVNDIKYILKCDTLFGIISLKKFILKNLCTISNKKQFKWIIKTHFCIS